MNQSRVTEAVTRPVVLEGFALGGYFHEDNLTEIAQSQKQRALDAAVSAGYLQYDGRGWYGVEYQTALNMMMNLANISPDDVILTDELYDQLLIAAFVGVVEAAALEIGALTAFELCSIYELVPDCHWNKVRKNLRENGRFYTTGRTKGTTYNSIFSATVHRLAGGEEA